MHLQIGYMPCWMDSSGPTFPFNLTAKRRIHFTTEIYLSFFFLLLLAVFKMDSREQLLAVSLTIMNVTWYRYSSKSIGCLPGMYLLHTERVERLIYTKVDIPGNEFGKGTIK